MWNSSASMNMWLQRFLFTAVSILIAASAVQANEASDKKRLKHTKEGWFYGFFVNHRSQAYLGMKEDTLALPMIGYLSDTFRWTGPILSYTFTRPENLKVSTKIQYRNRGYSSKDSVDLEGMDKRSGSLFGGIEITKQYDRLSLSTEISHDLQARSNGFIAKVGASYFYNIGPFFFTPKLSVLTQSHDYNTYYYGVKASEETASRDAYSPSRSYTPKFELGFSTPILFGGFTRLSYAYSWLDEAMTRSPIVSENNEWQVSFSFSRFF